MARDVRASLADIVRAIDATGTGITSMEVAGAEPRGRLPPPHRQGAPRRGRRPMRDAWTIATKDLRRRLRDRTAILVALVLPLGLAWIFSLTLGDVETQGWT